MIVMVSTNTLSAREPDQSARMKPTEITSKRPASSTSSIVGTMIRVDGALGEHPRREVDDRLPHLLDVGRRRTGR